MNTLAVILARKGSVGLPNKHLLPLLGRPVIGYTFEHAKAARTLKKVVVSTDCPEVQKLARQAKLTVVDRPAALATGDASVQDVMLHAMDAAERDGTFTADALVVLYGNVPIRGDGTIDACVRLLAGSLCDSVRTFCPVGKWHPAWMSKFGSDDRVTALEPGSVHRRQDLPQLWLHDGACVAVSRASMLRGRTWPNDPHAFFGTDRRGVKTDPGETVEIDHRRDLYWAEAVLRDRQGTLRKAS
ncbi:MAG TPA: acylneuraminate cytidylyltransferase family protein [Tepidisphaeraceae bacterium]|nr:acylneuraminate cytidylyltransferase family protein [Tepidisphaeraceae bacterium]